MAEFRIKQAVFETSVANLGNYPFDERLEIAVAGKSNVGKSSLINALTNNRKLAQISSRPGKTRYVNFFLINGQFHLVDLPGYGFARASKDSQASWGRLVEGYLSASKLLRHVFLLVDLRHEPTANDKQMCVWLRHFGVDFTVVATKCDKLAKSKWINYRRNIEKSLGLKNADAVLPFSSAERIGTEAVLGKMGEVIEGG